MSASGLLGGGYEYVWKGITRVWRCPRETMERLDREGKIFYTRNGIARRRRYLDEAKGIPAQDIWSDIQALRSWHDERLGYPTQKPVALLERIIRAFSNSGDVVLDPFCRCGTTIHAAQKIGRQWIGMDITYHAINLTSVDGGCVRRRDRVGRERSAHRFRKRKAVSRARQIPIPTLGAVVDRRATFARRRRHRRRSWRR